MWKKSWAVLFLITPCLVCAQAHAADPVASSVPVGLWKTIDDDTQKEKSLVRITEAAGVLSGRVEKVLDPARQDAVCQACPDELKDRPVLGLQVLSGVRKSDAADLWDGGTILDPNTGKTYRVRLKPLDNGKRLEVHGYIGVPLLGRTQTWLRVE